MNDERHEPNESIEPSTDYEERADGLCTELTQTEQRSLIFHLLYVIDAFDYDTTLELVTQSFKDGYGLEIPPDSNVFKITAAVVKERELLDEKIVPLIENWRLDRLGVATKLILRLSIWELMHTDTDVAVIINEAIELAKCFGEKDSYKFINGILDQFVTQRDAL